jgi:hypothetical protein
MEGASSTRGMQEREKAEAGRHEREKSGCDMFQGTHADEREQQVADIFPWQACRMNRTGWVGVRPDGRSLSLSFYNLTNIKKQLLSSG